MLEALARARPSQRGCCQRQARLVKAQQQWRPVALKLQCTRQVQSKRLQHQAAQRHLRRPLQLVALARMRRGQSGGF